MLQHKLCAQSTSFSTQFYTLRLKIYITLRGIDKAKILRSDFLRSSRHEMPSNYNIQKFNLIFDLNFCVTLK